MIIWSRQILKGPSGKPIVYQGTQIWHYRLHEANRMYRTQPQSSKLSHRPISKPIFVCLHIQCVTPTCYCDPVKPACELPVESAMIWLFWMTGGKFSLLN